MATKTTKAAKPTKSAKPESGAKKAKPEETQVASKPEKAAKAASKKEVIVKKDTVKSNAKAEPAKKAESDKTKTVNKKDTTAAEKKATTAKKTDTVKKSAAKAEEKETVEPTKKAPKTAAKEAPVKTEKEATPKASVKEPKPAKTAAAPPPPPPAPAIKKPIVKKQVTVAQIPAKPATPSPRPMATPAARSTEKKPTVVIAHRRLENKSKEVKEVANTMIQYQPETYRSILDEPTQQQGPIYRYSDEDLNEFREIITSRLDAARKELNFLQGLITRKDEAGTEDTDNRYMNMEDGSGAMEREQLAQLASRQIQFMGHLEKAMVRIENKTYGICRVTGKLIDKARLRAVPHATLSIEAKKMMGSKQN